MTVYERHGYENRNDYLEQLAVDHNIPTDVVYALADMLGRNEDFDGLVNALEDYSEY